MAKHGTTGDEPGRGDRFSPEELDELEGEVLPQRAATSLINPHLGMSLTAGIAAAHAPTGDAAAAADAADAEVDVEQADQA